MFSVRRPLVRVASHLPRHQNPQFFMQFASISSFNDVADAIEDVIKTLRNELMSAKKEANAQVSTLSQVLKDKEGEKNELNRQIGEISQTLSGIGNRIPIVEGQVATLSEALKKEEGNKDELNRQIQEISKNITNLQEELLPNKLKELKTLISDLKDAEEAARRIVYKTIICIVAALLVLGGAVFFKVEDRAQSIKNKANEAEEKVSKLKGEITTVESEVEKNSKSVESLSATLEKLMGTERKKRIKEAFIERVEAEIQRLTEKKDNPSFFGYLFGSSQNCENKLAELRAIKLGFDTLTIHEMSITIAHLYGSATHLQSEDAKFRVDCMEMLRGNEDDVSEKNMPKL